MSSFDAGEAGDIAGDEEAFAEAVRLQEQEEARQDREATQQANERIGDKMTRRDKDKRTRMIFHNSNGFNISGGGGGDFLEACQAVHEAGAEYYGAQEHNLDTNQPAVEGALRKTTSKTWGEAKLVTGTTSQRSANQYKPGGTLAVTAGHLVGRIVSSSSDYMGRWTRTVLSGRQGTIVVVYNTYAVGKRNPNECGETTVVRQQQSILIHEGRPDTDPCTNHMLDLRRCLREDHQEGFKIILGGNFNTTINSEEMETLTREAGLVDAIGAFHDTTGEASHQRGRTIINYVLISSSIVHTVQHSGYHAFDEHMRGDHRAMFVLPSF